MKYNLDKNFKTNSVLEEEGVDFAIDEKVSFRVRRFHAGNVRVKAAMAKYHKPYAQQIDRGTLSQEKSTELTIRMFIDVCLISWTGIEDGAGNPIEFSKEAAYELFKDLPEVFDTVWKNANDFANYKEDLGNS